MNTPEELLSAIEIQKIELEQEFVRLRSGISFDGPPEIREAELLEELEHLSSRAERLRSSIERG